MYVQGGGVNKYVWSIMMKIKKRAEYALNIASYNTKTLWSSSGQIKPSTKLVISGQIKPP